MHQSTSASPAWALVCQQYGNPPEITRQPLGLPAQPGQGEVVIDVNYAAFNFTDHLLVQGRYQDRPQLPFVPGLDAAGRVRAVGPGVSGFKPGDPVLSSGVVGAWATQLVAPAHRLVAVPQGLSLADAVASINSHLTAYHGLLDRAALQAGERVLVLGASGAVGKASVQIARAHGAQVFTARRQGDGLLLEGDQGNTLASTTENLKQNLRQLMQGQGADVVVDPVGGPFTEAAVRNLAWRGRLLVVGFAAGSIPAIPLNLLLLKGASIVGVYCGGLLLQQTDAFTSQLAAMLQLMQQGLLSPSPNQTLPADNFDLIWQRYTTAGSGSKVLLGFTPQEP